jgi:hypothetical protein
MNNNQLAAETSWLEACDLDETAGQTHDQLLIPAFEDRGPQDQQDWGPASSGTWIVPDTRPTESMLMILILMTESNDTPWYRWLLHTTTNKGID